MNNKLTINYTVSADIIKYCVENDIANFVCSKLSSALAEEIVKTLPVSATVCEPIGLEGVGDVKYSATINIFTDQELCEYAEKIRISTRLDIATSKALQIMPIPKFCN